MGTLACMAAFKGWGKKDFAETKPVNRGSMEGVQFTYVSKDRDKGYPGTIECRVWYAAAEPDGNVVLDVDHEVELVGNEGEESVLGMMNHRQVREIIRFQPGIVSRCSAISTSILVHWHPKVPRLSSARISASRWTQIASPQARSWYVLRLLRRIRSSR